MAGHCQNCGKKFKEPGPLCWACIPEGCNVAGFTVLAGALGVSRVHVANITVNSAFNMPIVKIGTHQNIYCTHVNTALWEFERKRAEGNAKKKFNLPQFETAVSSCYGR